MAKQQAEALRELQTRLAERLQAARTAQVQTARWLAVECAGWACCCRCAMAGEIFSPASLADEVPHTQPWLLGVANLRGGLHGVVDLASSWGCASQAPAPGTGASGLASIPT
jgi:twitching motility protein PilI